MHKVIHSIANIMFIIHYTHLRLS